ncbi:hypothetical protein PMAYCL1PPCAC_23007 [Pristionchus mayeri]|uniref:Histone-lysine N-methyltransferase, H3 lysine-79 specific n=1 Tax=Pristionchus mayeri TaxID=1317129 RepID=A0AAN5I589_9BILA|nr:hypothetical protein PMAYCL1PPCAC_23007 [Pristionchus mayeri]
MEVEAGVSQQEQDLGETRHEGMEEVPSEQGDTESVAESVDGGLPGTSGAEDSAKVKFKLLSPMGGKSIEFTMTRGLANRDIQEELTMHLTNIFKLGLGIKEAFEKSQAAEWQELPWSDPDKCPAIITRLNKCIASVVSLWRGATRPHTDSEWFQSPFCTSEQSKKLSFTIFNRVVKNAQVLNKCYKSFTSQTYGETSFDQIQIILDRLQMTDKDVFVDLGSGVGHVVTYAAAYTMAKKCVGIEINSVPAEMSFKMKKEFEGMMSWYGKKYRPFDLVQGDFLDPKFRKLITEEATVIYINNFAFEPDLMFKIKQMVLEQMATGVRIICTKSLLEERDDRMVGGDEDGEEKKKKSRPLSNRSIARQTVDMMLDCEELPIADAPVSWSAGKGVQFLLFTVNHSKIEQVFSAVNGSQSGSSSTRSASAESVNQPPVIEDPTTSITATIDEVAASHRGSVQGGGRIARLYPEEEDSDDDEDYAAPGSRKWSGLKDTQKRRGRDDEYVPRKRNSTGASGGRHAKKDNKKESRSRRAAAAGAALTPMHNAGKESSRVKKEEASHHHHSHLVGGGRIPEGGVVLDPSNAMDAHLIELRQSYMDFMTYLTTEEAKRRLMEEYHNQTMRNQELTARIQQMVSTVEQLLNAGVQTLNCRLHELEMTDVTSPADILNRSKQIVTAHKDVTLQVSAMESQVLSLERQIRTSVPYGQALIEKLDSADFSLEDPYGVLISQACAETATNAEDEMQMQLPDHLLSPTGRATPARRQHRPRPRASQARRSGGAAAAAATAATAAPTAAAMPGAKADNDEVERQIAEIVQKALQVDSVAKEKERRARGAGGAPSASTVSGGGGSGDRKRSGGGGGTSTPAVPPSTPVTSATGAYAMTAAELLRYQLPSFDQSMDFQHHH